MRTIQLLCPDVGGGLAVDQEIVTSVLTEAGYDVVVREVRLNGLRDRLITRRRGLFGKRFDLNLFLEVVDPAWLTQARKNVVIPNPEWWRGPASVLRSLDMVFCKSNAAVQWLTAHGARCTWTGFTSRDRSLTTRALVKPDQCGPLHIAGSSGQKGTSALVNVWSRNPQWPVLTVVARPKPGIEPIDWNRTNVHHVGTLLDDSELRRLQNSTSLAICPSEMEGYGHTIVEAMSCERLILTVDAPPMNELIAADRGLLAAVAGSRPAGLGHAAILCENSLESCIDRSFKLSASARERLSHSAREWFKNNHAAFPGRLLNAIQDILRHC